MSDNKQYRIQYKDYAGNISERTISGIEKNEIASINAYCHLRQEHRTFNLNNVILMVDIDTGEIINPWVACGLHLIPNTNKLSLTAVLHPIRPALVAMKFFCLTHLNRFDEKKRRPLVNFSYRHVELDDFQEAAIDTWIKEIWTADIYRYHNGDKSEYTQLLSFISKNILPDCRDTLIRVMSRNGRRPIEDKVMKEIEQDYCS